MVKRQTPPRPQGRKRPPQGAAIASGEPAEPTTTAPAEDAAERQEPAEISPVALLTVPDGPLPQNAVAEPIALATEDPGSEEVPPATAEDAPDQDSPIAESLPASPDVPLVVPTPAQKRASIVPADLAAAGATLQAFLLNEGIATLAHWRALATVRTPAEAIRLHVDEMQRAAEASLTCLGRIAGHLGRSAAAA